MWFIILAGTLHGQPVPRLSEAMSNSRFISHRNCMIEARDRATVLRRLGVHGRYLCMYHDEPDRALARTAKVSF